MSVTLRWSGTVLMAQQRQRIHAAVLRSAALVHNRARVLCSVPARRQTRRRTRNTIAGRRGSTYTVYTPSSPGQPPALRSGVGRSAITWWIVDPLHARVGIRGDASSMRSTGDYMIYHEFGGSRLPRRPWLSRALDETAEAVRILLTDAARV